MASIRDICVKTFQEYCKSPGAVPYDLKDSLRYHERIPVFIDNLAREFMICEKTGKLYKGKRLSLEEIVDTTRDMTKMFINNLVRQKNEMVMSEAAKQAALKEQSDKAQLTKETHELMENSKDESTERTKEGYETTWSTHEIS